MILNVYKPKTWTSFDVVANLKNKLKLKKVGHAGTLDPLAEGVLVVLTDGDTKQQEKFMKGEKEYVCDVTFNIHSPTLDLELLPEFIDQGVTLEIIKEKLPAVLNKYTGDIEQAVPEFSAKKILGKPMYKTARENLTRAKPTEAQVAPMQKITIYSIETLKYFLKEIKTTKGLKELPTVMLKVKCTSGTYIRSFARDLGVELGTKAILTDLIRTRVGDFRVEDSKQISEF